MLKRRLIESLEDLNSNEFDVVVLPHFCIDSSLKYKGGGSFIDNFEKIQRQGGGNIEVQQNLHIGGKAANCASALLSLGIRTHLIAKTDQLGYIFLEHLLGIEGVDLSHVKRNGDMAITTAIELDGANVMLSDPGSASQFGPECLTDDDEKLIGRSDIISISDWGLNEKGTELAEYVFGIVRSEGDGKTFFDPGDPSPKGLKKSEEIEWIVGRVLSKGLIDVLGMNEDEAIAYGGDGGLSSSIDRLREMSRVDLHTKDYARSYLKESKTGNIPAFDVRPMRLTGAGDAWNAGDILGEVMGISDDLRLLLANAVAAYYISDPDGRHPEREDLIEFLQEQTLKS